MKILFFGVIDRQTENTTTTTTNDNSPKKKEGTACWSLTNETLARASCHNTLDKLLLQNINMRQVSFSSFSINACMIATALLSNYVPVHSFIPQQSLSVPSVSKQAAFLRQSEENKSKMMQFAFPKPERQNTFLQAQEESSDGVLSLSESDQISLGVVGTKMSLIMLCSEYVLKTTGCGLPAGPLGLIGAAEGISYLGVTALVAFSLFTKVKTGSGLPAGPKGILRLAEGLSFLAVLAGIVVLIFQVTDYGYVPNAVPMDGGMCQ